MRTDHPEKNLVLLPVFEGESVMVIHPRLENSVYQYFRQKGEIAFYERKNGKETDFLIMGNGQPWCLFEAKLQDDVIGPPPSSPSFSASRFEIRVRF